MTRTFSPHGRLRQLSATGPIVTSATRAIMVGNRGKNTGPEMTVRRALHAAGLRYRIHVRELRGSPDVVIRSRRTIVEVRGCFWHGHTCDHGQMPKTRSEFWAHKIALNRERDARNEAALREEGWNVVVVWECEVKRGAAPLLAERLAAAPQQISRGAGCR